MLLQRLSEYADRLDLPPQLYSETPIRYIIELDKQGAILNPRPTDTADPTNSSTRRGVRRMAPQIQRTVGVKPLLLADNAEYTLGLGRPDSKEGRVAACHAAYMELLERCAQQSRAEEVKAVVRFLQQEPARQLELPEDYDRGSLITFRVADRFVTELPAVQDFWAGEHDPAKGEGEAAPIMQCLICGQERPVLERLQGKIKGVPGGQTSGTSIISANAEAFTSYGLEGSLIAPTCARCGERFTKAVNALLADKASRIILNGTVFLWWTRERVAEFSWSEFITNPDPGAVENLLRSIHSGKGAGPVDETAFYATSLSGSGGRTVVRDWIDTTVGEAKRQLARWFERQRVVDEQGGEGRPLGLYALAGATVRELKDVATPTTRSLLRAALEGAPLSPNLLYQAVRRNRAEQKVTRQRAALIKLVLCSKGPQYEEEMMIALDPSNPNPAYRCGRLLAVLEEVQRLAVPGIKATIVDRFFGTASSAPNSVFARLVRGAQPHLAKLERDKPGAYRALQSRLEEIMGGLRITESSPGFPRILTLE